VESLKNIMRSEFILTLSKKLNQFNVFPIGCSKKEIEHLEEYTQVSLPETYREFLSFMGRGAGKYFIDINIFYNRVFENRNAANGLLEDDESDFSLDEIDFVFCSYQGEQFMYFNLRESNDPSVYYYVEGAKAPIKKYDKFTECILEIFKDTFG
jgi:SMI1-KNR4 cell-wall